MLLINKAEVCKKIKEEDEMNSKKSLQKNPQYQAKLLQTERAKQETEKMPERSDLLDDDDDNQEKNNAEDLIDE